MRPVVLIVCLAVVACSGDDGGGVSDASIVDASAAADAAWSPGFPADYAATYTEVRDCRRSGDHNLAYMRVLADPTALGPYTARAAAFPEGAVVMKEEYDFGDADCTGEILRWTTMVKLADGTSAETLGWRWQTVGADRVVDDQDRAGCIGCHTACGVPPDGYEGTCTVP